MKLKINISSKDNILIPNKERKQIHLHPGFSREYYNLTSRLFKGYATLSTEWITLRTILIVNQNIYSPGQ